MRPIRRQPWRAVAAILLSLLALPLAGGAVAVDLPAGVLAPPAGTPRDGGPAPTGDPAGRERLPRVYVLVFDGLDPARVTAAEMPTLHGLLTGREPAFVFDQARAVMAAETNPNHTALLTGTTADVHGIPYNLFYDVAAGAEREMDDPALLQAETLFTLVERVRPAYVTAGVFAKHKLYRLFSGDHDGDGRPDADHLWQPAAHQRILAGYAADDPTTMDAALQLVREADPDFLLVNLAGIDVYGHGFGPDSPLAAQARAEADRQLARFLAFLRESGRWSRSVVFLVSDHGMDATRLTGRIALAEAFRRRGLEGVAVAANGGIAGVYVLDPRRPDLHRFLQRLRLAALAEPGVAEAYYVRPNPVDGGDRFTLARARPEWHLDHPRAGDLVVVAERGHAFAEPTPLHNPLQGNHGHPPTLRSLGVITGGWPGLRPGRGGSMTNADVAPTVAWLLRLPPPAQATGRVLREAFRAAPPDPGPVDGSLPPPPELERAEQGVDPNEEDSARRAVQVLTAPRLARAVDLVAYYDRRRDRYVVRDHAGMVAFRRQPAGYGYRYRVVAREGRDPLQPADDAYPHAFERIAALFDDPRAPDLVVVRGPDHDDAGIPGHHGSLNRLQSQGILVAGGAGIRRGAALPGDLRMVDVAPTVARLLWVAPTRGYALNGRVAEGLYLRRQDGRVIDGLLDGRRAEHAIVFSWDAARPDVLARLLAEGALPNLRRLLERGSMAREGLTAVLPSVTVPDLATQVTGAYNGRHGIVGNGWYERLARRVVDVNSLSGWDDASRYLRPDVETLHEALDRTYGSAYTAAINMPPDRGADYSSMEYLRLLDAEAWQLPPAQLAAALRAVFPSGLLDPEPVLCGDPQRLASDPSYATETVLDNLAISQLLAQWSGLRGPRPRLAHVELAVIDGASHAAGPESPLALQAYRDADCRLGYVLRRLEQTGTADRTAVFVVSDHGQQLADPGNRLSIAGALAEAGLRFVNVQGGTLFLYLRDLDVAARRSAPEELEITVRDDDTLGPVAGARVLLLAGDDRQEAVTDELSQARLPLPPGATRVRLEVSHPDYNPARREFRLPR